MLKKWRLGTVLATAALSLSLLVSGCGGAGSSADKAAGEKVTIRFAHWRGEDAEVFNKIIDKFQQENPNIKVEMNISGSEAYIAAIQAELQSSKGADIFTAYPGSHFNSISKANAYVDLTNEPFVQNFESNLIKAGQKDGKQLALPYHLVYNIPIYNKAIFARYNLEPPKDWNGFLALCDTLKKNGVTPILLPGDSGPGQFINPMLMNNAPDEDIFQKVMDGKAKLTDEWFVKTLAQIKELSDKGYFQKDVLGSKKEGVTAQFAQGQGAMLAMGSYMMATVKKQNPQIEMGLLAPITVPADKAVWEGIHTTTFMLGINAKSKHQAEAKKFLEFLTRPEIASLYANETGQMLTVKGIKYESAELQEQAKWLNKKTRFQPRYTIPDEEVKKAVEVAFQDVIAGLAPQEAAAKAQAVVERVRGKK